MAKRDGFGRDWILKNAIPIIEQYEPGMLTLRGLHYRLVSIGMPNTLRHYKRVVDNLGRARWDGQVEFDAFSDHERSVVGFTEAMETDVEDSIEKAKDQLEAWMTTYKKNRWENQPYYPQVWIEKKALQGTFEKPCRDADVALAPCKGYPSLTFLHKAALRFRMFARQGKKPLILYFGDYDASGENIPEKIEETLAQMGARVELRRIALYEQQVIDWDLPIAPSKQSDSRTANWDGLGQVELDAVEPMQLRQMCADAIESVFDRELYEELMEQESEERERYQDELRTFVNEEL